MHFLCRVYYIYKFYIYLLEFNKKFKLSPENRVKFVFCIQDYSIKKTFCFVNKITTDIRSFVKRKKNLDFVF